MTFKKFSDHAKGNISEVGVWYCDNCSSFHVKAGEVLLTFTRDEFAAFSSAVFDCYSSVVTLDDVRERLDPGKAVVHLENSHVVH